MPTLQLHEGDNRLTLRRLIDQGVRVHSVVTDPPYGLVSIQKRFANPKAAAAKTTGNDGSFNRLSAGFMGKAWDGTGIERDPEFWALIYEILLPGGYVFAFSGSRTGHWQACAMEMAGFTMHPMHGWCFGSGFPKAHAADKAIDKHLGVKGEVVAVGAPVKRMIPGADQHATGSWEKNNGREYQPSDYVPATDEAAKWSGWAYGTQTQKPALEPIYLGQKPFDCKTGAANILTHGVGAVNIDGCRVPAYMLQRLEVGELEAVAARSAGRHPANLILDGSPEVTRMFPNGKSGTPGTRQKVAESHSMSGDLGLNGRTEVGYADEGSAARFFHNFTPDMDPLFYNPKAGKLDRAGSEHPTVKPISLMQYLIRHITPPGGVVLDPFAGSGTTAVAAANEGFDCVIMEAEGEYIDFLKKRFPSLVAPVDDFDDLMGTPAAPVMPVTPVDDFDDLMG